MYDDADSVLHSAQRMYHTIVLFRSYETINLKCSYTLSRLPPKFPLHQDTACTKLLVHQHYLSFQVFTKKFQSIKILPPAKLPFHEYTPFTKTLQPLKCSIYQDSPSITTLPLSNVSILQDSFTTKILSPLRFFHPNSSTKVAPPRFFHQGSSTKVLPPRFFHQGYSTKVLPPMFLHQCSSTKVLLP